MFCRNCGAEMKDDQKICEKCGFSHEEKKSSIMITVNSGGMIWYNILKYGLFVVAAIRLLRLILPPYNSGAEYVLTGIWTLIEVFLMAYVAYELHVYRKDAPKKVLLLLAIILVSNIVFPCLSVLIVGGRINLKYAALIYLNTYWIITIVYDVVMIIVNKKYFENRKEKFTKGGGFLLDETFNSSSIFHSATATGPSIEQNMTVLPEQAKEGYEYVIINNRRFARVNGGNSENYFCPYCYKQVGPHHLKCEHCGNSFSIKTNDIPLEGKEENAKENSGETVLNSNNSVVDDSTNGVSISRESVGENDKSNKLVYAVGCAVFFLIVITALIYGGVFSSKYTCGKCGEKTKTLYYDAFDPTNENAYMCDECAAKYYSPFPYRNYVVNP